MGPPSRTPRSLALSGAKGVLQALFGERAAPRSPGSCAHERGYVNDIGTNGAKAAKLPQAAVAYQDSPKNGQQCDNCGVFIAPNSCKTVTGVVSPTGWCKIWVKKA